MATVAIRWTRAITTTFGPQVVELMDIYVDDEKVATIGKDNPQCEIQVSSGQHEIYARAFIMSSKTINFSIEDHQILKFRCSGKHPYYARGTVGVVVNAVRYAIPGQVLKIDIEK